MNFNVLDSLKSVVTEEEIIALIKELVQIPSYNGVENQETEVAKHIHSVFQKEGIDSEVVHVADGRCNVIAKIKGNGSGKTLLLTGHMDTVPPYDMDNPFQLR